MKLAARTGCRYHVCHISTKESVALIRQAKRAGVAVTCETAPHYLLLCEDDLQEDGLSLIHIWIRTVSLSVPGRALIISVIKVLLVKNAALSVRRVFADSAILLNAADDRPRGLSETNFFKAVMSVSPWQATSLRIAAVLSGGQLSAPFIFFAMD